MSLVLLLLAAALPTAVDAERAFDADARKRGQWTAFRAWAADDAVMFTPQPVQAQQWLKDRPDPPRGLTWSPNLSFVACDGNTAVNHGPWRNRPRGTFGTFTTVWVRQAGGGWKWVYDAGEQTRAPLAPRRQPAVYRAPCGRRLETLSFLDPATSGTSADGTLQWSYAVMADGARSFTLFLWNGSRFEQLFYEDVAAE